eukprot:scaffold27285_cov96-Phaeocystis_antarctica.AAC.1
MALMVALLLYAPRPSSQLVDGILGNYHEEHTARWASAKCTATRSTSATGRATPCGRRTATCRCGRTTRSLLVADGIHRYCVPPPVDPLV